MSGIGNISVMLDGRIAGNVQIQKTDAENGKYRKVTVEFDEPAGKYELSLLFNIPEDLRVVSIILE